jgi:hypothetical protein
MTPLDRALRMTSLDRFWSFTFIIGSYRILPMLVVKNHHRVRVAVLDRRGGRDESRPYDGLQSISFISIIRACED